MKRQTEHICHRIDGTAYEKMIGSRSVADSTTIRYGECQYEGCTVTASFGYPGTKRRMYCKRHKTDDMIYLGKPKCQHEGCTVTPSYGYPGTKKKMYCKRHKTDGMIDSAYKCQHTDCTLYASFGYPGTKQRLYCKRHRTDGTVYLTDKKRKRNSTAEDHGIWQYLYTNYSLVNRNSNRAYTLYYYWTVHSIIPNSD